MRQVKQQACLDDVQALIRSRLLSTRWDETGALVVQDRLTPGDRHQVHVHVSAETLADTNTDKNNVPAETLHPETIRRLACDGGLVTIIENAKGSPLNVGRKTRLDNLVLLCGRHHRAVHEFGYRIERTNEGRFEVVKPVGSKRVCTSESPSAPVQTE